MNKINFNAILILSILISSCQKEKTTSKSLIESTAFLNITEYSTLGNCCLITVSKFSDTLYTIDYANSVDLTHTIVQANNSKSMDSVVEQRSYECEYIHQKVPFNYKIE